MWSYLKNSCILHIKLHVRHSITGISGTLVDLDSTVDVNWPSKHLLLNPLRILQNICFILQMHKDYQCRLWGPEIHHQCQTVCKVRGWPERSGGSDWHWRGNESWVSCVTFLPLGFQCQHFFWVKLLAKVYLFFQCWQKQISDSYSSASQDWPNSHYDAGMNVGKWKDLLC